MPRPCADRNLLFGAIALRQKFISRDALIDAMGDWVDDPSRSLGEILVGRGSLASQAREVVDTLIDEELEVGGDIREPIRERSTVVVELDLSADEKILDISLESGGAAGEGAELPVAGTVHSATRYRPLWPHAKGGVGQIFVAEDAELGRKVALKEIQPQHLDNPNSRTRFLAEARITANLEHPGIVPVYGQGIYDDGRPYYAMRLIKGEQLTTAIHRFHTTVRPDFSGLEFRWLLRRFHDVCNTIAYAHDRGILHRDLKPGNVMLGPFGETLVMDWGLAKSLGRRERASVITGAGDTPAAESPGNPLSESPSVTRPNSTVGTPVYMSPEQAGNA